MSEVIARMWFLRNTYYFSTWDQALTPGTKGWSVRGDRKIAGGVEGKVYNVEMVALTKRRG